MNSNEIKNLEDALAIIQALQSENAKLQSKVDEQNIRISNLTEMIIKTQKRCSASQVRVLEILKEQSS